MVAKTIRWKIDRKLYSRLHHQKPPINFKITENKMTKHDVPPEEMQKKAYSVIYAVFFGGKNLNRNQIKLLILTRCHGDTISQILNEGNSTGSTIRLLPQINGKRKEI